LQTVEKMRATSVQTRALTRSGVGGVSPAGACTGFAFAASKSGPCSNVWGHRPI
jgi:hypothetical protein